MTITLKQFLRELATNVFSDSSKKATSKLSVKLTSKQCFIIHCVANNDTEIDRFFSCRTTLKNHGYMTMTPCPVSNKPGCGNIKYVYDLTPKGKAIHAEIVEKFMPVVNRINTQIKVGI